MKLNDTHRQESTQATTATNRAMMCEHGRRRQGVTRARDRTVPTCHSSTIEEKICNGGRAHSNPRGFTEGAATHNATPILTSQSPVSA